MTLQYGLDIPIPDTVTVGEACVIPITGWYLDEEREVKAISVCLNDEIDYPINHKNDLRFDVFAIYRQTECRYRSLTSGFYGIVPFPEKYIGSSVKLTLKFQFQDSVTSVEIGTTYCQYQPPTPKIEQVNQANVQEPLIAICMATYEPKIDLFRKQIESIISQTHKNWILIINDDNSSTEQFQKICNICAGDSRIKLFQNPANLGFYRNFEKALERVSEQVDYIALADQDDYWYEHKLSRCLQEMNPGVSLVYSDMKIVKADGEVISNTYWRNRRNHYDEIYMLLLANTITGAASLFRRDLLKFLLPFPYPLGIMFHDQWLGVVARATGKISYIAEPLYNYIQHGSNIIGHCDYQQTSFLQSFQQSLLTSTKNIKAVPAFAKSELKTSLFTGWDMYRFELRRLELLCENLRRRLSNSANANVDLSVLDMFSDRWNSSIKLLRIHWQVPAPKFTTNYAELRLMRTIIVVNLSRTFYLFFRHLERWRAKKKPMLYKM